MVNLAVLASLLLAVWGCGEVYYRYLFDSTDSFGLTRVCRRWFKRHYVANNAGVRDDIDYLPALQPLRHRVTFLGDSFTAGHGIAKVSDRFVNRIRMQHTPQWDVHALAGNGLDTGAELEAFAGFVQGGYQLEAVVLVYVLNDIADLVPEWQTIQDRIYAEQTHEPFLVRHSYFVNVLYYRLKAARDPDVRDYYRFVREAYDGPAWEQQCRRLQSLQDFCAANHVRLMVVTFPFLHALGPEYPYADVHRKLDAFWKDLGVPHLDLLNTYTGMPPRDLVIGKYDAHPNLRAHALAAKAIGAFVESHLDE
ncbi:MAG: SGNH/GDSL hydrolase family protein [Lentisphaerae bacterium]|nr:SGNH/GDSL hydrolase family protein [Lentisphaerota bacterium]